jgi:hypothetical protein
LLLNGCVLWGFDGALNKLPVFCCGWLTGLKKLPVVLVEGVLLFGNNELLAGLLKEEVAVPTV